MADRGKGNRRSALSPHPPLHPFLGRKRKKSQKEENLAGQPKACIRHCFSLRSSLVRTSISSSWQVKQNAVVLWLPTTQAVFPLFSQKYLKKLHITESGGYLRERAGWACLARLGLPTVSCKKIVNTFNDWSLVQQWILLPSNLKVSLDFVSGNIDIRGKENSLFPEGPVIKWFVIRQINTKANFKTPLRFQQQHQATSFHALWSDATAVKISVWRHSFRNVARSWHLTVNSFLVRCRVTMN